MNKYINIYMLGIPLLVLALVSAAIIVSYATYTGEFDVTQSIEVTGNGDFSFSGGSYTAGESFVDCIENSVKNVANVDVPIQFGTTCSSILFGQDDGIKSESLIDWVGGGIACDGITTEIYGILELSKKTTLWQPTGNSEDEIVIRYTLIGDTFEYDVISGDIPGGYELVYAMDKDDRWTNYASVIKVEDISGDLPYSSDWNIDANPNYCSNANEFDSYEHCVGAKLWIVKTLDLGTLEDGVYPLNWADMWNYYYETDLIVYSSDTENEITLPANGGGFDFCVQNDLVTNLQPDKYTITTDILPA